MNFEFTIADERDKHSIFLAYYNYFQGMFGRSLTQNTSRRAIVARNYESRTAAFLDSAYEAAGNIVNNFLPNNQIMKVLDGGVNVGYFRIMFMQKPGEVSAHIGEVVIPRETLVGDKVEAYKTIVGAIERELKESTPDIAKLSFEVIPSDELTAAALAESGYGYTPLAGDGKFYTIIYEKSLLEEEIKKD